MMKVVICSVNSAYHHSSLACAIIAKELEGMAECETAEYTVNQRLTDVVDDLCRREGDVYMFSCCTWSMSFISSLVSDLKKLRRCMVVLGGQEITNNPAGALAGNPDADCFFLGDAEGGVKRLIACHVLGHSPDVLPYVLSHRTSYKSAVARRCRFEDRPFPYSDANIDSFRDRLVYYETSRGCPHRCSFCLSSSRSTLSFVPLRRVESELDFFISRGVPAVKLIDRTFNADPLRAKRIITHILKKNITTTFHLEIRADELDEETIELLRSAPPGFFQLECGLQSTNPQTIAETATGLDAAAFRRNLAALSRNRNVRIHVDLIAMLPHETLDTFMGAFDTAFLLFPDMLQLGFLKLIKGTRMNARADFFSMIASSEAPHEVLRTSSMSHADHMLLKRFEYLTIHCLNSGAFTETLRHLTAGSGVRPSALFMRMISYFESRNLFLAGLSRLNLYRIMHDFIVSEDLGCEEILVFDFLKTTSLTPPAYMRPYVSILGHSELLALVLSRRELFDQFTSLAGLSARDIVKKTSVCVFRTLHGASPVLFADEKETTAQGRRKHLVLDAVSLPSITAV